MRYLSVVWLLPLLLFGRPAEAATISFASGNCGTPPLLGLTFTVQVSGLPSGGTVACPGAAVGSLVTGLGTPLYGSSITSIGFTITNPGQITASNPLLVTLPGTPAPYGTYQTFGVGSSFTNVTGGFVITAPPGSPIPVGCTVSGDGTFCFPPDLEIFVSGFAVGTTFTVTSVNGSAVPEPATLTLLGLGLAAAAVRRRRSTAGK